MRSFGFLTALSILGLALSGCGNGNSNSYQGWAEGDFVFVGPDEAGRVEKLAVREGDTVKPGDVLFTVDAELQEADLKVAEAVLANSRQAFERAQQLLKTGSGSQKTYDEAQSNLREAEARLNAARTRLVRRQLTSPVGGVVQQIYYRPGEVVPAARAAISVLPPGNIKIRFFVPQAVLPTIAIDDPVSVRCDGCTADIAATITFIAGSAEYTPPVIYSLEERQKLVFLVEARPETASGLRVGQPVSVTLKPREGR
ncbi:MAG TPA: efflux RND transporter periplasmic adaptor subunit [Xanthobacteraceae bacterium]|jgi:HlyD family secretion protein